MEFNPNDIDGFLDGILKEAEALEKQNTQEESFRKDVKTFSLFIENGLDMTVPNKKLSPEMMKHIEKQQEKIIELRKLHDMLAKGEITYKDIKPYIGNEKPGWISAEELAAIPKILASYENPLFDLDKNQKASPSEEKPPTDAASLFKESAPEIGLKGQIIKYLPNFIRKYLS